MEQVVVSRRSVSSGIRPRSTLMGVGGQAPAIAAKIFKRPSRRPGIKRRYDHPET